MDEPLAQGSNTMAAVAAAPEIIDVDNLADDDEIRIIRTVRPTQRRTQADAESDVNIEPIIVLDSDEEAVAGSSGNHFARPRRIRRRVEGHNHRDLFSPSPPLPDNAIPPVPPVPRRFSAQGYPMRRRPPPDPVMVSGVVRPNAHPFPFEAQIRTVERQRNSRDARPDPHIQAARPSHHQPSMGFGGALLSLHNDSVQQRLEERRSRTLIHRASDYVVDTLRRHFYAETFGIPPFERRRPGVAVYDWDDDSDGDFLLYEPRVYDAGPHQRKAPAYKPQFTHPGKPSAGFTFDFGSNSPTPPPHEAAGPSAGSSATTSDSDAANPILVCARCLDPLVLNNTADDEERAKRRLWGLRCGHLIDGKCAAELMQPLQKPDATGTLVTDGPSGSSITDSSPVWTSVAEEKSDAKGKGKAIDVPNSAQDVPENSMRSRLRPRPQPSTSSASQAGASVTQPAQSPGSSPRRVRPLPKRILKKGKGRAHAPAADARYEWMCPVTGCHHQHLSVHINGKWVMDETQGAVGVYV